MKKPSLKYVTDGNTALNQNTKRRNKMASVRLSRELSGKIARSAMDAFDRANPEITPSADFTTKLIAAIQNMPSQIMARKVHEMTKGVFEQSGKLIQMVPEYQEINNIDLYSVPRNADEKEVANSGRYGGTPHFNETIGLPTPIMCFRNKNSYNSGSVVMHCEQFTFDVQEGIKDLFVTYISDRKALSEKRYKYRSTIHEVLGACNTLKQLLETWPAAESLVPQELIAKMHKKETRIQAARERRESIEFDATLANQVVLTSKLMGG